MGKKEKAKKSKSIMNPSEINENVSIPMYAPNMGLSPKEYQISPQLSDMEAKFKKICMEFITKSNPDQWNSSYMDAVIERICVNAIKYIKMQRCDHVQMIMRQLDTMRTGDLIKAKDKLQHYLNDREENIRQLKKYRKILWKGTCFEEEVS